jgi:flagellar biosynthesis protein FlhF
LNSEPPASPGATFAASDIGSAIAQVRTALGPDAVVLNIRRVPPKGLAKLWAKPHIEVVACAPAPEPPPPTRQPSLPTAAALQRYARSASTPTGPVDQEPDTRPVTATAPDDTPIPSAPGAWRVTAVLERLGLTPVCVQQVLETMQALHGPNRPPPPALAQELTLARTAFTRLWRTPPRPSTSNTPPLHVLVGPPGSGKSTALCKWLAQTVLVESRRARVWRLDARGANTAESVSIYGDILGVPVDRTWKGRTDNPAVGFVDLPGVDFHDASALDHLATQIKALEGATVHLVLNAAYTVPLLLAQARAFARLPVADLILTHLDEEPGWGKLWNLVLGTNYPLSFLSVGQNIPGRWSQAQPDLLTPPLFAAS